MGKIQWILVVVATLLNVSSHCYADEWARTYGGSSDDVSYSNSVYEISDGGYVVAGETESFGAGNGDFRVLKLNSDGSISWDKTYGGSARERYVFCLQQTIDGGSIVAGLTDSFGSAIDDIWVLKLDSEGVVEWQKTFGASNNFERIHSLVQTRDDGYILAGHTRSFGAGDDDIWILKLDSEGTVLWQKTYGTSGRENAPYIQQTQDGGYIVGANARSFGASTHDAWLFKLYPDDHEAGPGVVEWQKTYGGSGNDHVRFVDITSDGGYIVTGPTDSFGAGGYDTWVFKLTPDGDIVWQKTYGGGGYYDYGRSIQETSDHNYIMVGFTESFGAGGRDIVVLKLNSTGMVIWQKTYGGSGLEEARSIGETSDGGYIVAGETESFGAGGKDIWVLKLDGNGEIPGCSAMGTSNVTVTSTSIEGQEGSSIIVQSPSYASSNTYVSGQPSLAETSLVCFFTSDTPPSADAGLDEVVSDVAILNGSGSSDADGTIDSYQWELVYRGEPAYTKTASGVSPLVLDLEPGFYDVTLTVTDDDGYTGSDTILLASSGECIQDPCDPCVPCNPCDPSDAIAKIEAIVSFFNASVEIGTIKVKVPQHIRDQGRKAVKSLKQRRIDTMNALLETAERLIKGDFVNAICGPLEGAYTRIDGQKISPRDWFKGDAVPQIAGMLHELLVEFGCETYDE